MAFQDCYEQRVLRIDQLDAGDCDQQILGIVQSEIAKGFKYFQPGILAKIDPELKAILNIIIWKFSIYLNGATLAQQMFEMKYKSMTNDGVLTKKQKIVYGLVKIGGEWLVERSFEIKRYFSGCSNIEKVGKCLNFGVMVHQFLSLLNFVAFLRAGRYKSLLERTLGFYAVFTKKQSARQGYFEYMNQDILKNGFAEFLFCILPLVNIPRFQNLLLSVMWKKQDVLQDKKVLVQRHCGACGEFPTNVHHTRCGHVFCYICIKANLMADPSFLCPVCGEFVGDVEPASV